MKISTQIMVVLSLFATSAFAKESKTPNREVASGSAPVAGVSICAAECRSESLGIKNHDASLIGKIYYAPYNDRNSNNSLVCIENAKTIEITSNRITDYSLETCLKALKGDFFGKKVDIIPSAKAPQDDEGTFFRIKVTR